MPRFCRRYPKLADSVLRQMMELLHVCPASLDIPACMLIQHRMMPPATVQSDQVLYML